jgi:hypothetical protein
MLRFDRLAPAHYVGALCLLGTGIGIFIIAQGPTYKVVKEENKNAVKNSSRRPL